MLNFPLHQQFVLSYQQTVNTCATVCLHAKMKTITNRNYGVLWEVHLLNHCQLHVKVPGWSLVLQSVTDGSQMLQPAVLADVWWDYSMCICVHMSNSSPIWFCSFEVPVWKYYGRENVTLEIALLSYCTRCYLWDATIHNYWLPFLHENNNSLTPSTADEAQYWLKHILHSGCDCLCNI